MKFCLIVHINHSNDRGDFEHDWARVSKILPKIWLHWDIRQTVDKLFSHICDIFMVNTALGVTKIFSVDAHEQLILFALIRCCALHTASDQGLR